MFDFGIYIGLFFLASIKFLFAPLTSIIVKGYAFWDTFIITSLGGITGVSFFYFTSSWFMKRAIQRRSKKELRALKAGKMVERKNFTKFNKFVVKTKKRLGIYGLAFLTPFILSIPIGTIICVKFYRHNRFILPILYIAVIVCSLFLCAIATYFGETIRPYIN